MNNVIMKKGNQNAVSRLVSSMKVVKDKIETTVKGQYGHTVIIRTGDVVIKNSELDCEFTIPFDDDPESNEAEIIVYNLTTATTNHIKKNAKITVTAGYGNDTGIIFSGYVTKKKTTKDGCDKILTIRALDDRNRKEKTIKSKTYAKGTKASKILRDLCVSVGLPIAKFTIHRDYTYKDEETIDGSLMDNIVRLAKICGVSAYILKGRIYIRPLDTVNSTPLYLSADTGLLSAEYFEEEEENEKYKDLTKGYDIEMILQHRVQTASVVSVESDVTKGRFRVKSGEHTYNGSEMLTKIKAIQKISTTVKKEKKSKKK